MISNITYWLDETADKFPDKVGFIDENKTMTFMQFRTEAMVLASEIVKRGYFKKPIAIFMEKGVDVLVAFLAVAYSGNFYSPIDVDMPQSRVEKIFQVLEPQLILTKIEYKANVNAVAHNIPVICTDDLAMEPDEVKVMAQRDKTCDTDLLYVLFTSGSTGTPKGVTICHQSVIDYIDWVQQNFEFDNNTVFGNQAPFYFDNSILDIYTTIKVGATLNIIPRNLFSWPVKLLQFIDANNVNAIFWVPSAMILVSQMRALTKIDLNGKLKKILFCGEVMPNKHLNNWRKSIPNAVYCNLYGPTEITDACTYYIVDREFGDDELLPIGIPIPNTDILVLNDKNELVMGNEIGELCVRGTSLSKGYYNNPQKTVEAFVQNPLHSSYPELIYRTGDLVHYNEYGELVYVSRKDFQIKHMGHRIELGEIEAAVTSLEGISMSCCLYDEEKRCIVLIIAENMELGEIKEKISKMLPEYMIPTRLIKVNQMPLNFNGKIDRVKLKELL